MIYLKDLSGCAKLLSRDSCPSTFCCPSMGYGHFWAVASQQRLHIQCSQLAVAW